MAGTLHGDRAPIAHGRRVLRHGRAPKGADVELFSRVLIPGSSFSFMAVRFYMFPADSSCILYPSFLLCFPYSNDSILTMSRWLEYIYIRQNIRGNFYRS